MARPRSTNNANAKKRRNEWIESLPRSPWMWRDWYHLDCLQSCNPDTSKSMLDGFVNYAEMLNRHGIKATFFVLGELAQQARETLLYLDGCGHEIACHGMHHTPPTSLSPAAFAGAAALREADAGGPAGQGGLPGTVRRKMRWTTSGSLSYKRSAFTTMPAGWMRRSIPSPADCTFPVGRNRSRDALARWILRTAAVREYAARAARCCISGGGWMHVLPWHGVMKPLIAAYLREARGEYPLRVSV